MKIYRSIQAIYLKAEKLGLKANNNRRAVYCWETQASYVSANEAARQTGIERSQITLCCNGKPFNTAGGYHWCFLENKKDFVPQQNPQWHQVYCFELKRTFNNATEAAKILRIDATSIRHCCLKDYNKAGGYHWCFIEDKDIYQLPQSKQGKHGKGVICIEAQQYFYSAKEAQSITKTNRASISRCCNNAHGTAGGYHWRFATEEEIQQQKYIEQPGDSN